MVGPIQKLKEMTHKKGTQRAEETAAMQQEELRYHPTSGTTATGATTGPLGGGGAAEMGAMGGGIGGIGGGSGMGAGGAGYDTSTTTTTTGVGAGGGLEGGMTGERAPPLAGGSGAALAGEEMVCGRQVFTQTEDRPILKERVERVVEHRPVEKEFVTETRFVGERPIPAAAGETSLGVTERVVEAAQPGPTCPVPGAPIVSGGGETVGRVEDPTAATGMTGVGTTSGAAGTGRFDEGGRML